MLKQTSGEQPRICSEEIGQVSVLVSMDLVVSVGGDVRNPRYKCNVSLATCEKLASKLAVVPTQKYARKVNSFACQSSWGLMTWIKVNFRYVCRQMNGIF
jgi:hypothetical protein